MVEDRCFLEKHCLHYLLTLQTKFQAGYGNNVSSLNHCFLTMLEILNRADFISALTGPFVNRKIGLDFFKM